MDYFGTSYLTNPPEEGTSAAMFNNFISAVEGFLNTTRTEMSLSAAWNATKPSDVAAPTFQNLLTTAYADLIALDQIDLLADSFIADYKAANGGRMPFVNPGPLARWAYGRALPAGRRDEALANKTVFMDWVASEVLKSDPVTCSDSIFVYPQSQGRQNYRNWIPGVSRYVRWFV